MLYDLRSKVDIQIGPIEVTGRWFFDIEDLAHWYILEPWEVLVRHKVLLVSCQKPHAVTGDVRNLNR